MERMKASKGKKGATKNDKIDANSSIVMNNEDDDEVGVLEEDDVYCVIAEPRHD